MLFGTLKQPGTTSSEKYRRMSSYSIRIFLPYHDFRDCWSIEWLWWVTIANQLKQLPKVVMLDVDNHAAPGGHDGPTSTNLDGPAFACRVFMDAKSFRRALS